MRQVSIYGLLAIGMTFVILTPGIDLSVGSLLALAGLVAAASPRAGSRAASPSAPRRGASAMAGPWPLSPRSPSAPPAAAAGPRHHQAQGPALRRHAGRHVGLSRPALLFAGGGPISGFDEAFAGGDRAMSAPCRACHHLPGLRRARPFVLSLHPLRPQRLCGRRQSRGRAPVRPRCRPRSPPSMSSSASSPASAASSSRPASTPPRPSPASAYELTVIASVVIGGTCLFGGIGTIFGTVIGTLLIGVLLNGLVLNNVSSYIQQIIIGVIIVLAVAFDTFAKSRRRRAQVRVEAAARRRAYPFALTRRAARRRVRPRLRSRARGGPERGWRRLAGLFVLTVNSAVLLRSL